MLRDPLKGADGHRTILAWHVANEQAHKEIQLAPGRILGLAIDKLASLLHEEGLLQIWKIEG